MAQPIRSGIADILLGIQAQLMSVMQLEQACVIIDTEGNEEDQEGHFQAETVVFLRRYGQSPSVGFEGAGRHWGPERVRISCVLWTRVALDNPPGYQAGLTDDTLGHEGKALQIRNAMNAFRPLDTSSNWLVQQPIEPAGGDGPKRRKKFDFSWAWSSLNFAVTYAPAVDQAYQ